MVAASHRDLLDREARGYLAKYGMGEPIQDPVRALAALAGECRDLKDFFAERVKLLGDAEWVSTSDLGVDALAAIGQAYERALDRCAKVLTDMARLGIEERLTRISEAEAVALGASLDRALAGAGVDAAQKAKVLQLLSEELLA
ncbi:MAG: hypothetical protein ACREN1_09035 [Candidatus Dormibacteria bacterium]